MIFNIILWTEKIYNLYLIYYSDLYRTEVYKRYLSLCKWKNNNKFCEDFNLFW